MTPFIQRNTDLCLGFELTFSILKDQTIAIKCLLFWSNTFLDVVINFDTDGFEVGVGLERVMNSLSTRSRLFATSERHVEAANKPAILPDCSSLKS
jgi:hypothetical protein